VGTTKDRRRVIAVDMVSFGLLCGALVDAFVNDDLRGEDARQIARAAWRFVNGDYTHGEVEPAVAISLADPHAITFGDPTPLRYPAHHKRMLHGRGLDA
jgi:hypothetical protein